MGEVVEFASFHAAHGYAAVGGEGEDFLELFLVRPVPQEDDVEAALPPLQRGQDRLTPFQMLHWTAIVARRGVAMNGSGHGAGRRPRPLLPRASCVWR
ncbi:MAG TPA: hypothetical protein VG269_19760 [Tepidisphaeraceae bacterium]|nr:hypothetical protein [Tepidisphaeraceae bacterium]